MYKLIRTFKKHKTRNIICFLLTIIFTFQSINLHTTYSNSAVTGGTGGAGPNTSQPIKGTDYLSISTSFSNQFDAYLLSFVEVETNENSITKETLIATGLVKSPNVSTELNSNYKMYIHSDGWIVSKITMVEGKYAYLDCQLKSLSEYLADTKIITSRYIADIKATDESTIGMSTEEVLAYYVQNNETTQAFNDLVWDMGGGSNNGLVYTNPLDYDYHYIVDCIKAGTLALHVEPIILDKTNEVAYTSAQYGLLCIQGLYGKTEATATNGGYLGQTPAVSNIFTRIAHLKHIEVAPGPTQVTKAIKAYDNPKELTTTLSGSNYKTSPNDLINACGIYIIKLVPKETTADIPSLDMNIPATDFYIKDLEIVPNEDGEPITILQGAGENGTDRALVNVRLTGGYNFEDFKWYETDGDIKAIAFTQDEELETEINNAGVTAKALEYNALERLVLDKEFIEKSTSSPLLSAFKDSVKVLISSLVNSNSKIFEGTSGNWLRLKTENIKITRDSGSGLRNFSALQDVINEEIKTLLNNGLKNQVGEDQAQYISGISGLELEWYETDLTYTFLKNDSRIKFDVFIKTESQIEAGLDTGIISDTVHITEAMDQAGVNALSPGILLTPTGTKSSEDGIISLYFDITPERQEELDKSNYLMVQGNINWVDENNRLEHVYGNQEKNDYDKWGRTEDPQNHVQGGYGWTNNWQREYITLPKPNLTAIDLTAYHLIDNHSICVEAAGVIATLPATYGSTISSEHTIKVFTSDGTLIGEYTEQFKDKAEGETVEMEVCIKIPDNIDETNFLVTYEINPNQLYPKAETTFDDNYLYATVPIGDGEINWKATDITHEYTIRDTGSSYIYDLSFIGKGTLAENGVSTNKIHTGLQITVTEVGNSSNNQTYESVSPDVSVGEIIQFNTANSGQFSVEVGTNEVKYIEVTFTINHNKDQPEKETTFDDNTVTIIITLEGPQETITPPSFDIPLATTLDCVYDVKNGEVIDLYNLASFTVPMPRDEVWGKKRLQYDFVLKYCIAGTYDCHEPEEGVNRYGASSVPSGIQGYTNKNPDNILDQFQSYPYDVSYSYFEYTKVGNTIQRKLTTKVAPMYTVGYERDKHQVGSDDDGNPIYCYYTYLLVYKLSDTLYTDYTVYIDESYTANVNNSRTYSTEAQNTTYDKVVTAGKGIQTTVRTEVVTDWPYEMNWGGHFVYSVASGENNHDKTVGGYYASENGHSPALEVVNYTEDGTLRGQGYYTLTNSTIDYTQLPLRHYTFKLRANENGIREVYTNVNYPEVKIVNSNNYTGLTTNSVVYLDSVVNPYTNQNMKIYTNSELSSKSGQKIGICYTDKLIPISNFYNDIYSSISIDG